MKSVSTDETVTSGHDTDGIGALVTTLLAMSPDERSLETTLGTRLVAF